MVRSYLVVFVFVFVFVFIFVDVFVFVLKEGTWWPQKMEKLRFCQFLDALKKDLQDCIVFFCVFALCICCFYL